MTIDIEKEYRDLEDIISNAIDKSAFIGMEMGQETKGYQEIVDAYDHLCEAMTKLHEAMDV